MGPLLHRLQTWLTSQDNGFARLQEAADRPDVLQGLLKEATGETLSPSEARDFALRMLEVRREQAQVFTEQTGFASAGLSTPLTGVLNTRAAADQVPSRGQQAQRFLGKLVEHQGELAVRNMLRPDARPILLAGASNLQPGTVVTAQMSSGAEGGKLASIEGSPLADPKSNIAQMYQLAAEHGLSPIFPKAVMDEVAEIKKNPGIDDPKLTDLTHLPFITIDNEDSKDLDQAMHIERNPKTGGYDVYYALADAAYYVKPGTELFKEAMRRQASFYLPGLSIPMLPRALSEDLVSLNEGQERRSLVFKMQLDANGHTLEKDEAKGIEGTTLLRARMKSDRKLSYNGVQRYYDGDPKLADQRFTETLDLLKEVGDARIDIAQKRGAISYQRSELGAHFTEDGLRPVSRARLNVERYNEQISLLTNMEGANFLRTHDVHDHLQAIFRAHDAPRWGRLKDFAKTLEALAETHQLDPEVWVWKPPADDDQLSDSLARFLDRLPADGPFARLSKAINRQAIVINQRSVFSETPAPHFSLAALVYARFSSPMREMVGIFTHKETLEILDRLAGKDTHAAPAQIELDNAHRAAIIEGSNNAKSLQKKLDKAVHKRAMDGFLRAELDKPAAERTAFEGTLMGFRSDKAYVELDDPPIEVKVYYEDLETATETPVDLAKDRTRLGLEPGRQLLLGGAAKLLVGGYDEDRGRFKFKIAP